MSEVQKAIRKLKTLEEGNFEQVFNEITQVNLRNYLRETAFSICETKMSLKDLPCIIEICSCIH